MNKMNVGYFSLEKTADIHYERLAAITTVFLSFYTLITGSMYSAIFCIVLWYSSTVSIGLFNVLFIFIPCFDIIACKDTTFSLNKEQKREKLCKKEGLTLFFA